MEGRPRRILYYVRADGVVVVRDWIDGLEDRRVRARILVRLGRVEDGNFGDHDSVGAGILELRLHFGKGYRIYFALDGRDLVLLLCAGNKSTQRRDIRTAQAYWADYEKRKGKA